jgi:succinyl-CoA synthetase alpha subunit
MSTTVNQVRAGFFLDSVALMRISRSVIGLDGVEEAALMMATPANKEIMANAGLLAAEGQAATGGDLVLGVRAVDEAAATAALAKASELLAAPKGGAGQASSWQPRSIRAAIATLSDANLALISVPGDFAAAESRKAIQRGLHTMIFSDNVSIEDERALKHEARERGLLVMGPDCGTAIIGGVPLAFANVVPRGNIGIIGASGTGTQEVSCLIAQRGGGISHAIGVGGRDLKEEIGGITTLMAMQALEADTGTEHIILISKPPAPVVAARIVEQIAASAKTYTVCLIGGKTMALPGNARQVSTLKDAAGAPDFDFAALVRPLSAGRSGAKGLFCGGTLAAEAQAIFRHAGEAVSSNAPIPGVANLETANQGHPMIDLGADEYTRGRPHPMIDPAVRDDIFVEALADPGLGLILLDVVIGYGADKDPAGRVAQCLADATAERPLVVASVTGTDDDPQNRAVQIAKLMAAGVLVASSNADAAALAVTCLRADG